MPSARRDELGPYPDEVELAAAYSVVGSNGSKLSGGNPEVLWGN